MIDKLAELQQQWDDVMADIRGTQDELERLWNTLEEIEHEISMVYEEEENGNE